MGVGAPPPHCPVPLSSPESSLIGAGPLTLGANRPQNYTAVLLPPDTPSPRRCCLGTGSPGSQGRGTLPSGQTGEGTPPGRDRRKNAPGRRNSSGKGPDLVPAGEGEASTAHQPSPEVFAGRALSGRPGSPTQTSVGVAFPAAPARGHPAIQVWGSPRSLTCAESTGRGQWGLGQGAGVRGGRGNVGGAAPQTTWAALSPSPRGLLRGPMARSTPVRTPCPSDPAQGRLPVCTRPRLTPEAGPGAGAGEV